MPEKVITLAYDEEYDFVHDFEVKKTVKTFFKIRGSKVVYNFIIHYDGKHDQFGMVTIAQDFRMEYSVVQGEVTGSGVLTKAVPIKSLMVNGYWDIHVKLTFKRPIAIEQPVAAEQQVVEPSPMKQEFAAIHADLRAFIERGPNVTLVGHDGNVTVPKRLLELRSEALEMILNSDSQEKRTRTIELKDFDSKILNSFSHFLLTKEIKNGIETATGLILLGDKYNIQVMKTAAEDFVKRNIKQMDQENVFEVLSLVKKDLLKQAMLDAWSNGY